MEMPKKVLKSLNKVIEYLYEIELESYEEFEGDKKDHVIYHVDILQKWLEKNK